jgi:hypothetical protein
MIIFPSSECAKSISGWQLRCGVDRRREGLDIRPYRRAEMDTSGILKRFFLIGRLLLLLPLVGCAASQATQEIQQGRRALLTGSPEIAVQHFERAAALDGKNAGSPLGESTWTYIGRAYYGAINIRWLARLSTALSPRTKMTMSHGSTSGSSARASDRTKPTVITFTRTTRTLRSCRHCLSLASRPTVSPKD